MKPVRHLKLPPPRRPDDPFHTIRPRILPPHHLPRLLQRRRPPRRIRPLPRAPRTRHQLLRLLTHRRRLSRQTIVPTPSPEIRRRRGREAA